MRPKPIFYLLFSGLLTFAAACSKSKSEKDKGGLDKEVYLRNQNSSKSDTVNGWASDSLLEYRPGDPMLTGWPHLRFIPIFLTNYDKNGKAYWGSISHYDSWWPSIDPQKEYWRHFLPGFEASYGYNIINLNYKNFQDSSQGALFPHPVLLRTIYLPAFRTDTLAGKPIFRNFGMVSAHKEDTNQDSILNANDLRWMYWFRPQNPAQLFPLLPFDCTAQACTYDAVNDYLFVRAGKDKNGDGMWHANEPILWFFVDLKNPANAGPMMF